MVSETSGTDNRAALLEAFRAVRDVFASFGDPAIGGLNLYQAEDRVGRELFTLFDSCQSMAMDMITARVFGPFADYAGGVDRDVDTAAFDAVRHLFGYRKAGTGLLEIVGVVLALYEKNPSPSGGDVFSWLRGTVRRQVNNYNYSLLREKNPEYARTGRKIARFLANSERYEFVASVVRDTSVELERSEARIPTADEIISMCGRAERIPTTVPEAVDQVFDLLACSVEYRSETTLRALRESVFRLLEPRLPSWNRGGRVPTPWDDLVLGRAERTAIEVLEEAESGYRWRRTFTDDEKTAFLEAGRDYLYDIVHRGGATIPLRKYLAAHIEECGSEIYGKVYKGSLQNFFKHLLREWRRRMTPPGPERKGSVERKHPRADSGKGDI